jgi:hypothetical protein
VTCVTREELKTSIDREDGNGRTGSCARKVLDLQRYQFVITSEEDTLLCSNLYQYFGCVVMDTIHELGMRDLEDQNGSSCLPTNATSVPQPSEVPWSNFPRAGRGVQLRSGHLAQLEGLRVRRRGG